MEIVSEFGTSGKLFNSNLVTYDRKTDTYWTQIGGKAVLGQLTGQKLKEISIDTVEWRDWADTHPDSEVLSQLTGYTKAYGNDPYEGYYTSNSLKFPVGYRTDLVHPKAVIFGIEVNGQYKAYLEKDLKKLISIRDTVKGIPIRISRDEAGAVKVENLNNGEEIVKERMFFFAWYAFHPDMVLYEAE
jgi:hypothetical protein